MEEKIKLYREYVEKGDIPQAYHTILNFVHSVRNHFFNSNRYNYTISNVSAGYMDYSYFSFWNTDLKNRKLRFGVVLNHKKLSLEFWLIAQNELVYKKYCDLIKDYSPNKRENQDKKNSVIEVTLREELDFLDLNILEDLNSQILSVTKEITELIKTL